jgi:hypothetical protein
MTADSAANKASADSFLNGDSTGSFTNFRYPGERYQALWRVEGGLFRVLLHIAIHTLARQFAVSGSGGRL